MTGNIALDVVIGLVFVFLLYSLMASVIAETIASFLGLRARNLHKGITRLLEEDPKGAIPQFIPIAPIEKIIDFINDAIASIIRIFKSEEKAVKQFYEHPSVKFLAKSKFFSKPSYIAPNTFSKVVLDLIKKGQAGTETEQIKAGLTTLLSNDKFLTDLKTQLESNTPDFATLKQSFDKLDKNPHFNEVFGQLEAEINADAPNIEKLKAAIKKNPAGGFISGHTLALINSYLVESNDDIEKFKTSVEGWFNTTMDRISGWYKRKNQLVLLVIGFGLAASFKASTIDIAKRMSKDPVAREQMVQLATAYIDKNQDVIAQVNYLKADSLATGDVKAFNVKLDSLLAIKEQVKADIAQAHGVLGLEINDSILLTKIKRSNLDSIKKSMRPNQRFVEDSNYVVTFDNNYTASSSGKYYSIKRNKKGKLIKWDGKTFAYFNEWLYFWDHFWGYLLTALAVSLGAPFWFDLLNKFVKLRSSVQPSSPASKDKNTSSTPPAGG
ncbi:MAG: hypothetical protein ACJAUD_001788 [Crocinitomicaceae bacterium]|jgi:hypothetical protein